MPGPVNRVRGPRLPSIHTPIERPKTLFAPRRNKPKPGPPPRVEPAPAVACCATPELSDPDDDGPRLCYSCGKVLSSESTITAEITFGETAAGAAVVQGGYVGENQRHANTMGGTVRGLGGSNSRDQTEWRGKSEIQKLCAVLNLRTNIEDQANTLYKLALNHNFVQGRRIRNIAAVCIYLSSRRQPLNTLMLMDLAEKIQVNIWTLGDNYKKFLEVLMIEDPEVFDGHKTIQQIEPLMLKFCRKLEFGEDSHRVAEDACKILKRMSRDWMVQGRQPAGLCGACIILAARMNNFRRTVREVVYVVKVADSTINSRLHEFRQLKTAQMTVEDFRKFGHLVKVEIMPPAIYKREEKERKKRRKEGEEDENDENDDPEEGAEATPAPAKTRKKRKTANTSTTPTREASSTEPRRDEDGFVIPDLPGGIEGEGVEADEEAELEKLSAMENPEDAEEYQPVVKRKGRPKKNKAPPYKPPPEDLEVEADLEAAIEGSIQTWDLTFKAFNGNPDHPLLVAAGKRADAISYTHRPPDANVNMEPDILEDEFEDDEDVKNCVLTDEEVAIKSYIWVTENEDWLRENQRKIREQALEAASGKPKKAKTRRKHRQIGDGSLLRDNPASTAAEAVQTMLKERAKGTSFSTHVNYEALKNMYGDTAITPASSAASPAGESPAASGSGTSQTSKKAQEKVTTPAQTQQNVANANAEEEDYDEEEYAQQEEYEEDDEHQYMENTEDYGFDEDEEDYE